MGATSLTPCNQLQAGEVGYLTASIKTVQDTRVGDTVTLADRPTPKPLPGYRQVKPMVFCGIYPADGAKYPDLKDALEKLQLNDASLTFEPETSRGAGLWLPLRLPGPAAHGDHHRAAGAGVRPGPHHHRPQRQLPPDPDRRHRGAASTTPPTYPDPSQIAQAEEPFVDVAPLHPQRLRRRPDGPVPATSAAC